MTKKASKQGNNYSYLQFITVKPVKVQTYNELQQSTTFREINGDE